MLSKKRGNVFFVSVKKFKEYVKINNRNSKSLMMNLMILSETDENVNFVRAFFFFLRALSLSYSPPIRWLFAIIRVS